MTIPDPPAPELWLGAGEFAAAAPPPRRRPTAAAARRRGAISA